MTFTVRKISKDAPVSEEKTTKNKVLFAVFKKTTQAKDKQTPLAERTVLQKLFLLLFALLASAIIVALIFKILLSLRSFSLGMFADSIGTMPATDANGYTNILLLGQGDKSHEGIDLTDTIMIASIDVTATNSVVMLSIPRDTIVTTEYFGERSVTRGRRINTIYRDIKADLKNEGIEANEASKQALTLLEKEISALLQTEIHGTLKVDFIGFEKLVDELGGVEVDVPYAIVDREYPDNNYGYQVFTIGEGVQVLDGATALKYARSRHSTSDFSRSARQQQIISAIGRQAKEAGILTKPNTIAALLNIASENVEGTLRTTELIGLAAAGKSIERDTIRSFQLNDRNGLYGSLPEPGGLLYSPPREEFGGAAVLLPVSIPPTPITWDRPKKLVQLLQEYRELYLANPRVSILNAGARSGAASLLGYELERFGFNVVEIDNAETEKDLETSIVFITVPKDVDGNEIIATETLESVGQIVQMPIITEPAPVPEDQQEIVTIVLGEDYTYTPLHRIISSSDSE